ncbi:MAG: O-antigen ligase family protein [Gammaproteobacteria bacterium]|nr:O-antigen ligase family protein [Gammaproteobacteria bacterium]
MLQQPTMLIYMLGLYFFILSLEPFLKFKLGDFFDLIDFIFLGFFYFCYVAEKNIQGKFYKTEALFSIVITVWIISSLIQGVSPVESVYSIFIELKYVPIAFLLLSCSIKRIHIIRFLRISLLVIGIQWLIGFLQIVGGEQVTLFFLNDYILSKPEYRTSGILQNVVSGTLLSKNFFSFIILISIVIVYKLKRFLFDERSHVPIYYMLGGVILILVAASKTVWLLLFSVILVVLFSEWIKRPLLLVTLMFFSLVALITVFSLSNSENSAFSFIADRFSSLFDISYYEHITTVGRITYALATLNILSDSPLIGIGAGNWGSIVYYKLATSREENVLAGGYYIPKGVFQDNNLASIAGQHGLLGFILFIVFLLKIWKNLSMIRYSHVDFDIALFSSMRTVLFLFIVMAVTTSPFQAKPIALLFWILIGLSLAYSNALIIRKHNLVVD